MESTEPAVEVEKADEVDEVDEADEADEVGFKEEGKDMKQPPRAENAETNPLFWFTSNNLSKFITMGVLFGLKKSFFMMRMSPLSNCK